MPNWLDTMPPANRLPSAPGVAVKPQLSAVLPVKVEDGEVLVDLGDKLGSGPVPESTGPAEV